MSKEVSASLSGYAGRDFSNTSQAESKENGFGTSPSSLHFPPPRTPFNAIADPDHYQNGLHDPGFDANHKLQSVKADWSSDRKFEDSYKNGNACTSNSTPKFSGQGRKVHSEPNSTQSTPAKSSSRVSLGGAIVSTGSKVHQHVGGRGGSSFRLSRRISIPNTEIPVEVPHLDLVEDPSFWKDHNVQVLIRIRPLSTTEKVSQGYGRCLRQESAKTLVWLGQPETRFTFDHIACETISQEKLFEVAGQPMVENCMSGYNSCMFAYGQTGSGKTYTMMGGICEVEGKLSEDCGLTLRIFEHLFTRIKLEEKRKSEVKLKYSCKCSFLELYNEQIADLLEPSSTNLQLREDLKKGVYVENLTEHHVMTVNDVVKLLLQGTANRKMAATHMNSESSRSHSVFTCIIESHWEKDSMTHFRFARLNLVDLAGSERQKSSGAEGDRLKEAANINKSLSTLGLVIMSLVDLAHGKHRHVPYRDSRLTFLLQDSLGGNSKTTIIANVSPSLCSANETLSTLKFAQRAKQIQNDAKVNEDASGDETALHRQILHLKGQLSFLLNHGDLSRSLLSCIPTSEESRVHHLFKGYDRLRDRMQSGNHKMKLMEATLIGALRREKVADAAIQKLEFEIEHMKLLAFQQEEDAQHTKMLLKFCEEKIRQLEMLLGGMLSADQYLLEENKALVVEIKMLQAKINRNPEFTRVSLENSKLIEQLQVFQKFYKQGEREALLTEVAELRNELLIALGKNSLISEQDEYQDFHTLKGLVNLENPDTRTTGKLFPVNALFLSNLPHLFPREAVNKLMHFIDKVVLAQDNFLMFFMNDKLSEENELEIETGKHMKCSQEYVTDFFSKHPKQFGQTDNISVDETMSIRSYCRDDILSYITGDDENSENELGQSFDHKFNVKPIYSQKDQMDARSLIETMDSEHNMQDESPKCKLVKHEVEKSIQNLNVTNCQNKGKVMDHDEGVDIIALQIKLEKMTRELEEVRLSNVQYQENQIIQQSQRNQIELVRQQAEMETASTILQLQEEVEALQLEFDERLCGLAQENSQLRDALSTKDEEIRMLCIDWETAIIELTGFLQDSSRSIRDANGQIDDIANLFPKVNIGISEKVQRAIHVCVEKEERILLLHKSLEDAQLTVQEMELKLDSLKRATLALNELHQMHDNENPADAKQLSTLTTDKTVMVEFPDSRLKIQEDQLVEAEKHAWLSHSQELAYCNNSGKEIPISKLDFSSQIGSCIIADLMANKNAPLLEELDTEVDFIQLCIVELKNITSAHYADMEMHVSALYTYIHDLYSDYQELVKDLVREIHELMLKAKTLNENCRSPQDELSSTHTYWNIDQNSVQDQIKDKLFEARNRLNILEDFMNRNIAACGPQFIDQHSVKEDSWCSDCSPSSSDISIGGHNGSSNPYFKGLEGDSVFCEVGKKLKSKTLLDYRNGGKERTTCLKKELHMTYDAFQKLYMQINAFLTHDIGGCSTLEEMDQAKTPPKLTMENAEAGCNITSKVISDGKSKHDGGFLTRFEEAQAAIKEADIMLNALLRANENAKHLTGTFKQAGEQLQLERANLIKDVGQLKSSMHLKEAENKLLKEQFRFNLEEVANSVSSLEGCISQMQREVDEKFGMISCDVKSMRYEMLKFIGSWKSLMEDISSELMGRELATFVLYQCHVEEICRQFALFKAEPDFQLLKQKRCIKSNNNIRSTCLTDKDNMMIISKIDRRSELVTGWEEADGGFSYDDIVYENIALKKELKRKEVLLEGLLFDIRLLQESTSKTKDMKDESEKLDFSISQLQHELEIKTTQLESVLVQQRKREGHLTVTEKALFLSNSKLDKAKETIFKISEHNAELKMHLEDLYLKKSEAEKQLAEHQEVVNKLETEILHLSSSVEKKILLSVQGIENELGRVTSERDQLHEQVCFLTDKLDIAYALVDEKEAVAVEARQESEACKLYAEQKEDEVKILERSVEELESTINMLEKKVHEMDEEVERNRILRESLELETQIFRKRLLAVENPREVVDPKDEIVYHAQERSRQEDSYSLTLELLEAQSQIKLLEEERAEQDKEIQRHKEYISELVLHADAQATKYQQKYTNLEVMVRDASKDTSNPMAAPTIDKTEKSLARPRGSSSPFRCISNLVHQMNLEKEHELSTARLRIEELEGLATGRQKEICILNARLAAAESMTHDVIRDLLGVKLDLTKYANLIDQYQIQKMVVESHLQTKQFREKEQEVHDLRMQIKDLTEEKECYKSVLSKREAEALAAQIAYEKLRERDHLLSAQNEILKMDIKNLRRRIVELDERVQTRSGPREIHHAMKTMDDELSKRLGQSRMLLSRANDEIGGHCIHRRSEGPGRET